MIAVAAADLAPFSPEGSVVHVIGTTADTGESLVIDLRTGRLVACPRRALVLVGDERRRAA